MADLPNGRVVVVAVETAAGVWSVIAAQRDATFTRTADEIDISDKDSDVRKFMPGYKNESVSFDMIYTPADVGYLKLLDAYQTQTKVKLRRRVNGVDTEESPATIVNLTETFPNQDVSIVSAEFRCDGFVAV